jgi:hypothetical protein
MAAQHSLFAQQPVAHSILAQFPLVISTGDVTGKTCVEKNRLTASVRMREALKDIGDPESANVAAFFNLPTQKEF